MSALLPHLSRDHLTARDLNACYDHFRTRPDFIPDLISALDQLDPDLTYRALALVLKLARTSPLSSEDLARIVDRLDASDHWLHRLTACQLLSAARLPPELGSDIVPFLQRCFTDRRVIIRAWALTAMLSFRSDPRFRSTVDASLRLARRDRAKSMQARLRQILLKNTARRALHLNSTPLRTPTRHRPPLT